VTGRTTKPAWLSLFSRLQSAQSPVRGHGDPFADAAVAIVLEEVPTAS
jgi:hypothetical protein